ncbi:MAG: hypothetical protein PHE88_11880 [Elusimicrobia bacterium]|nr:hypothetical protein [Elusimicrobiota bacterium]
MKKGKCVSKFRFKIEDKITNRDITGNDRYYIIKYIGSNWLILIGNKTNKEYAVEKWYKWKLYK